ncbi:hypothetical protein [Kurthia sibirica]|uniref:Peptidyl-prolyl cis-trans isomerase n=1 Tax=Kurthia sibirica TaxID=202750 RepID=A0A2U3AQI0_9BACL|nr:hypothetical protein [Kurthia sibirica]PWI26787.1 hypothetical protein DEX24_00370 [Kurthia sibirica]GEK32678.1 hypothetical protein KSI01_02110 [Kurthia sibirica]
MESIIQIKGNVHYNITLDPSIWIFDDRKVDLTSYFSENRVEVNADEAYVEGASKFWSREIMEGAAFPPTLKSEKKFDRQEMKTGTFGIVFQPFLANAEPKKDAKTVIFTDFVGNEYSYALADAAKLVFQFSIDGKSLSEDGPIYLLNPDGSNLATPIKNIVGIQVD